MSSARLAPQFVEAVPDCPEFGVLYISMTYATAIHRCACGCGREVVTPFSPTDWKLHFDGENVTLEPSIGNWNFPCRSHYWIRGGKVQWAIDVSQRVIDERRTRDRQRNATYYENPTAADEPFSASEASIVAQAERKLEKPTLLAKMRSCWKRWSA